MTENCCFSTSFSAFGIFSLYLGDFGHPNMYIVVPSLVAQLVKNPPVMQETLVRFLGREDLLEKG